MRATYRLCAGSDNNVLLKTARISRHARLASLACGAVWQQRQQQAAQQALNWRHQRKHQTLRISTQNGI